MGLALITAGGTLGFVLIEGASFFDSLYLTVLTISTDDHLVVIGSRKDLAELALRAQARPS